ncbi:diguanylate cyclase [Paenibacillus sp. SYP-B3998]|uniref:Diguanylate cyclase n=1 Tax=Paenibacillus sp. SYP-B3998 TaxID=2678564 RepID=A0A6G3ZTH9_9BACL|nr:diguanylate cyclase [Paenibacillus sp. SYP-B3998]NEW05425.1 diguanylate cyclase [Paenibacillus sp. SYP-B3998]
MSELLRSSQQHSRAKHFEDFLRQGLVLSTDFYSINQNTRQVLQDAWGHWKENAGIDMLPPQTALLCVDLDLQVLSVGANEISIDEHLFKVGTSWSSVVRRDNPFARCKESLTFQLMIGEEMGAVGLRNVSGASIPITGTDGKPVAFMGLFSYSNLEPDELTHLLYTLVVSINNSVIALAERCKYEHVLRQYQHSEREFKKQDVLFEASKKLHAKIDVDSVLTEVIESIHSVYPKIQVDLLLSQDNDSTNLPVKPLNFQSLEDDICTRAFMEGHVIFEPSNDSNGPSAGNIAVPLSGKQGVYGVLHLQSEHEAIHASDLQFISLLADTAGSAFENAKLYEQSNLLINELRLINEITKQLNQSLRLNEIFNFASSELLTIFGADFSCILQTDKDSEKLIVKASNLPAMFHESFTLDQGFSGLIYTSKEPIIISDYWANSKVNSKLMQLTNSRSLIGSPILVNGEVVGVILVVHGKPNYFSYDNYKLLQVLSGHIGLAMTNASLHAEVKRMVITDNLTGLYVRHYLDEQANLMQKKDFCGSLIVVDIDNFKRVNDTYGHQVGDKILIQVSQIIRSSIRDSDIAARWGGEELAVYLPQVAKDRTLRIAERIRLRVQEETSPQVTVSCGVSDWNWEEDKISVESLFYRADMALYQAKHNGRNCIQIG